MMGANPHVLRPCLVIELRGHHVLGPGIADAHLAETALPPLAPVIMIDRDAQLTWQDNILEVVHEAKYLILPKVHPRLLSQFPEIYGRSEYDVLVVPMLK
ncbi:hypothetical protein WJX84_011181 [Apatococcus fuscideae]|uniref:Uncharacterized protein n=1 Tax=Apatococcus fuscideae TaxID=2026836 RepID=A0AAW1T5Q7_9CHLO